MTARYRRRTGDWIKLQCGDHVIEKGDPRHVGCVEAIHNSAIVLVRWLETGWLSEIGIDKLARF